MSLVKHIDLISKSTEELRGLLAASFTAAARSEPGSLDHQEAKDLMEAIKYELAVRRYTL